MSDTDLCYLSAVDLRQRFERRELSPVEVTEATLRRIEDGRDARLGSWLRLLQALDLAASADQLLPEHYRSPMAEARADSRRRHRRDDDGPKDDGGGGTFTWGDERR